MKQIIAIHFGEEPPFTAQENHPDAVRYQIGNNFVDAIGGKPTQAEFDAVTAPRVPQSVTMRQACRALEDAGLLDTVEAAIANMPGAAGKAARIDWARAQSVERSWDLVAGLASALSLSDEQLDALFIAAANR